MVLTAVIDEVIQLAANRKKFYEIYMKKYFPDLVVRLFENDKCNTYEYQRYDAANKALEAYLSTLAFDDIKDLQIIMYVGRGDESYAGSGYQQYISLKEEFDERGWEEKYIEANQMIEKVPLNEYLVKGKEIIGL